MPIKEENWKRRVRNGRNTWLFLVVMVFTFACAPQPLILNEHPQYLVFGSGGGFANQSTYYYFLANGKVYLSKDIHEPPQYDRKLSKEHFDQMVENIYQLDMINRQMIEPGNFYKFIEYHTAQASYKWVWHQDSLAPNAHVLYKNFKYLLNE